MVISLSPGGNHEHLFVYMVWLSPLLVLNKMVNSPRVGRLQARVILVAPFLVLAVEAPRLVTEFDPESRMLLTVGCLSYVLFGFTLNVVTRFREAYIAEHGRAESLRVEAQILESISDCFISLDSNFKLVYLNDAACTEFAIERTAALDRHFFGCIPGFFTERILDQVRKAAGEHVASVFEAQDQRGQWFEMRCFPRQDGMSIYFRNITEVVRARMELEEMNANLREKSELLDKSQDAIFVHDMKAQILYWNKGAERLFGWKSEEVMGREIGQIFHGSKAKVQSAFELVLKDGSWTGELTKHHKNGHALIVESRSTLVRGADGSPQSILSTNTDITERKTAEARIQHLAFYDTLTGLPNRFLLHERLESALRHAFKEGTKGALLFIDLDDFKTLNDSSGHETGDLLLKEVTRRLKGSVRRGDSVARLGGDEFVVMLEQLGADEKRASLIAKGVGQEILRALRMPYLLGNYEYLGTASIGITCFPREADTTDDLLKRADLAMYRAKAEGRNAQCVFDPEMETFVAARAELLTDLRQALKDREFELHYQPQMDINGRVIGAEGLVRWPHPRRGMVPPGEFIPLAEEAGLIVDLGTRVLEEACAQLARWATQPGLKDLTVAVNVSTRQFLDNHFVQIVERALNESGADPQRLKLEITESSAMEKVNDAIAKMSALRERGVTFSMDDFGTGYSSLSQLKRLPLDQLKIDQSFVCDVLDGVMDASIVRTIITLGRNLNLMVIAEGVETEEQREFLMGQGCYAYQGYLFSPAIPAREFETYAAERCFLKEAGVA